MHRIALLVTTITPVFALIANYSLAQSEPSKATTVKSPPLGESKVTATSNLGLWDDIFVPHDKDFVVLRRGEELFSLAMEPDAAPKKLSKSPAAAKTQIFAGAAFEERLWLFLNSSVTEPCAIDASTGEVVKFEVPGLKVPGSQTPSIGSSVIRQHASGAILEISGGDRGTWPRDGNRPVFFWMDLKSGKVIRFPVGSDVSYFSADERLVVFAMAGEKPEGPRTLQAIEMNTGARADTVPDRKELHVPRDWSDTQRVKPLYGRRPKKGDADYFDGLSFDGQVLPLDLGLTETFYLSTAKELGGFAGFRLRKSGGNGNWASPFWHGPVKEPRKFEQVATEVINFALLGGGRAVYVKASGKAIKESSEALVRTFASGSEWNLLDGVERLPPLEKKLDALDFITDKLKVELVESFGTLRHEPLTLCLCTHDRGDMRAFAFPSKDGPLLETTTWRREIVLTHDGRRYMPPLVFERNMPDKLWLHNSGKLLSGVYVWDETTPGRIRQVHLSERTVQMPGK